MEIEWNLLDVQKGKPQVLDITTDRVCSSKMLVV